MRRTTAAKVIAATTALAATSVGAAYATGSALADEDSGTGTTISNVRGHEVDEHAANGQQTAEQARAPQVDDDGDHEDEDHEDRDDS